MNVEGRSGKTILTHSFYKASTSIQDKKMTAPGVGAPEAVRRNKTRFEVNVSTTMDIISHRVWFCIPFS